jgi:lipid-binding SYLF domain-containing protein
MRTLAIASLLVVTILFTGCRTNPYQPKPPSNKAYALERKSSAALNGLYARSEPARRLSQTAEGILVFPAILKGGFILGGQGGRGTLYNRSGNVAGHYQNIAGSWGFQAGLQKTGYALFFMDRNALGQLNKTGGWEFGTDPNLTIVDAGVARSLSTTTASRGIYAFFFDQKGLMGGLSLQGTKITRVYP